MYSQTAHVAKYLAVSLKFAELNPGVKMYHILMQVGWCDVMGDVRCYGLWIKHVCSISISRL